MTSGGSGFLLEPEDRVLLTEFAYRNFGFLQCNRTGWVTGERTRGKVNSERSGGRWGWEVQSSMGRIHRCT